MVRGKIIRKLIGETVRVDCIAGKTATKLVSKLLGDLK